MLSTETNQTLLCVHLIFKNYHFNCDALIYLSTRIVRFGFDVNIHAKIFYKLIIFTFSPSILVRLTSNILISTANNDVAPSVIAIDF